MIDQIPTQTSPQLSEAEWALVLELLRRERSRLPGLSEHQSNACHSGGRPSGMPPADHFERLSMVDRIIGKVQESAIA
ncbi:MAG: hypothetical protein JJU36_15540 [Phycisphaeraceae bacterium]|nr:hypothetical protein [Phycisphaeraceae bacterium]